MKYGLPFVLIVLLFLSGCAGQVENAGEVFEEEGYSVEVVLNNLNQPWGMHFLDEEEVLLTEKPGEIVYYNFETKRLTRLGGVPKVNSRGQGGLLDVFVDDEYVYVTYSADYEGGVTTHLGRGVLDIDAEEIVDFEVLRVIEPSLGGGSHFGSRVIVDGGYVFFTTGDRGRKDFGPNHVSQDTSNELGGIVRLYKNGSVPDTNPFVGQEGFSDGIWSFGHRNVQGLTINPFTDELWISEHGEQDGDSLNIVLRGENYGWPIAHYGCTYGLGQDVGGLPNETEGVVDPVHHWTCGSGGFPPSGMTFYDGFVDEWKGDLFVGNLAGQYLGRFSVDGTSVEEVEPLLADRGWRVRDVEQGLDGYLYVITDNGLLAKITS